MATADEVDLSPDSDLDPLKLDTDRDGKPNFQDNDDDGDGFTTLQEDRNKDGSPANDDRVDEGEDGDNIPGFLDSDDDNDSVPTKDELGPGGSAKPRNTSGVPGKTDFLNPDDDIDGGPTRVELSVQRLADTSMNGVLDYLDDEVNGADAPPLPGPNQDSDHDSVLNRLEDANHNGYYEEDDTDGDGIRDYLDDDDDGDDVPTDAEYDSEVSARDFDSDGKPDHLDADDDDDGVPTKDEGHRALSHRGKPARRSCSRLAPIRSSHSIRMTMANPTLSTTTMTATVSQPSTRPCPAITIPTGMVSRTIWMTTRTATRCPTRKRAAGMPTKTACPISSTQTWWEQVPREATTAVPRMGVEMPMAVPAAAMAATRE